MFNAIPAQVIDFVRTVFAHANAKVSRTLSAHPSMHEESLDHLLIAELSAAPPKFFADAAAGVAIETHWLGGRRMYQRWEIADIAIFIILRRLGWLELRKVALLQTKRLYSREISVSDLGEAEYRIGIARLGDRTDPSTPLHAQRAFSFTTDCVYGAMTSDSRQVNNINSYQHATANPVFYAFYNPTEVPLNLLYPEPGAHATEPPRVCRRLQLLREWSHDERIKITEVLGRGA